MIETATWVSESCLTFKQLPLQIDFTELTFTADKMIETATYNVNHVSHSNKYLRK